MNDTNTTSECVHNCIYLMRRYGDPLVGSDTVTKVGLSRDIVRKHLGDPQTPEDRVVSVIREHRRIPAAEVAEKAKVGRTFVGRYVKSVNQRKRVIGRECVNNAKVYYTWEGKQE